MVVFRESEYLSHYGIQRRSGRYPWGSGGNEVTPKDFLAQIKEMIKNWGWSEKQVADYYGVSTTRLRARKSIAKNEVRAENIAQAKRLKDKGLSNTAAAERMGIPEPTFRNLIKEGAGAQADALTQTRDVLKKSVDEGGYLDVGTGVENYLNVSDTKLATAVEMLVEEGYEVHSLRETQLGTGKETRYKVLAPPGTTWAEINANKGKIKQINTWVDEDANGNMTDFGILPPKNISSDRIAVRYGSEGGLKEDGVMYIRPGVEDISMGNSRYAQVRIGVDGTHYLKGMAIYRDDLPEGVDILFNTNKENTGNKLDALKEQKDDPKNPFGAEIRRQLIVENSDGKKEVTSAVNILTEEGEWNDWSQSLASQVLSKQKPNLAKEQLGIAYDRKKEQFDDIMALTNPTVKRKLLKEFADDADASAVHLKAAALPGQRWQVILPVPELKDNEVYAPNFKNGDDVVLIRYPHGGTFEIPQVRVNNRHKVAQKIIGPEARDAIGINPTVAARLSGADFDGDTVLVIPNRQGKIESTNALRDLQGFEPKIEYAGYPGMAKMSPVAKQREMGDVSNLITDMTIKQAPMDEIARAVKHSMVVIDAEKHGLDYKRSARDNGITALKKKYQGGPRAGAATLISNAGLNAKTTVPDRKPRSYKDGGPFDKDTGKRQFVPTEKTYVNKNGVVVERTVKVPKLDLVEDVGVYSSGTRMEEIYVNYANNMKALGNRARVELAKTPRLKWNPSAKATYAKEVASLESSLTLAVMNRPRERQAQVLGNEIVRKAKRDNPTMDDDQLKKIKSQALTAARARAGAEGTRIKITPREWEAIQAGAISDSKLSQILDKADIEEVRQLATPRYKKSIPPAKTKRARDLMDRGYTREEIASQLGVPLGTLDEALYGDS